MRNLLHDSSKVFVIHADRVAMELHSKNLKCFYVAYFMVGKVK